MIDLGDKFLVNDDHFDPSDRMIEEIVDKDSTNNRGDIRVYFDSIRYYEGERDPDDPEDSYETLAEDSLEREIEQEKLIEYEE